MKKTILSLMVISAIVYSCKKDDDNKVNGDLLIGKWNAESQYRNVFKNNAGKRDTTVYQAGMQSWEVTKTGKVYLSVVTPGGTAKDTADYKLDGSKVILIAKNNKKDTFNITTLTSTNLQVYKKLVTGTDAYTEYWINYKK